MRGWDGMGVVSCLRTLRGKEVVSRPCPGAQPGCRGRAGVGAACMTWEGSGDWGVPLGKQPVALGSGRPGEKDWEVVLSPGRTPEQWVPEVVGSRHRTGESVKSGGS